MRYPGGNRLYSGSAGKASLHGNIPVSYTHLVGFYLQVLAPLTPIMYLESVVDGILKGLNQQVSSLKYSVADSTIRIVLIFFLVPVRGMEGFLFIMVLSNIFTSFLNLHRLLTVTGVKLAWGQWILKPILAITTAGAVALLLGRCLLYTSFGMPGHSGARRIGVTGGRAIPL